MPAPPSSSPCRKTPTASLVRSGDVDPKADHSYRCEPVAINGLLATRVHGGRRSQLANAAAALMTASFGFEATFSGTNAAPSGYTLNGVACS